MCNKERTQPVTSIIWMCYLSKKSARGGTLLKKMMAYHVGDVCGQRTQEVRRWDRLRKRLVNHLGFRTELGPRLLFFLGREGGFAANGAPGNRTSCATMVNTSDILPNTPRYLKVPLIFFNAMLWVCVLLQCVPFLKHFVCVFVLISL